MVQTLGRRYEYEVSNQKDPAAGELDHRKLLSPSKLDKQEIKIMVSSKVCQKTSNLAAVAPSVVFTARLLAAARSRRRKCKLWHNVIL